ncbi:hypothetical protein OE88DRAFT_1600122, partial [Heliocybe sulcata]
VTPCGRQKAQKTHPYIGLGRHFARAVSAFTPVVNIINHGLVRDGSDQPRSTYTIHENRMWDAFQELDKLHPGLVDRLLDGDDNPTEVAKYLKAGMTKARSDDTNGLKKAICEWVMALNVGTSGPKVALNSKIGRGFYHPVYGQLLCPVELDWDDEEYVFLNAFLLNLIIRPVNGSHFPQFLYEGTYNDDAPWVGLLRGPLLIKGYKHIFISPSSADASDGDTQTRRSGNAQLHGMMTVTPASLAYVAVQVRTYFALSSQSTFSAHAKGLDIHGLYNAVLDYLEDPDEAADVADLLAWWN